MSEVQRPVTEAADNYLDYFYHTETSYKHVQHVLGAFEFAVKLATQRALEQLECDALIFQFPPRPLQES